MKVTVVGAGKVGGGLGSRWRKAGHDVFEAGREDPVDADSAVVLLAVPAAVAASVAADRADQLDGRVLIDATNDISAEIPCVAEAISAAAPGARTVKAFNTVFEAIYGEVDESPGQADMAYCGDDEDAKGLTADLIVDAGFRPVDCGGLEAAADLEGFARMVIRTAYNVGRGPFAYRFADPADLG